MCMHIHFYATELRKEHGYTKIEDESSLRNTLTVRDNEEPSHTHNQIPDLDFEDMQEGESSEKEESFISETNQNPGTSQAQKEISTIQADEKLEYKNILRILMQDEDSERIKKNLTILKTCELSNFLPSPAFKKRKLEKQPDFLPKSRRLGKEASSKTYDCLMSSSRISDKQKLSVTDNLVNDFLQMLCENFSSEDFIISFKSTIESHLIMNQNKQYEFGNSNLMILPLCDADCWRVKIVQSNQESRMFYPDCETWQTGLSILLEVLQELTQQKMPHSPQMLERFRKFLQEIFLIKADPLDYCYKCLKLLSKYKNCGECPLRFCQSCLLNSNCPRH